jgi:hypothetical protein
LRRGGASDYFTGTKSSRSPNLKFTPVRTMCSRNSVEPV